MEMHRTNMTLVVSECTEARLHLAACKTKRPPCSRREELLNFSSFYDLADVLKETMTTSGGNFSSGIAGGAPENAPLICPTGAVSFRGSMAARDTDTKRIGSIFI